MVIQTLPVAKLLPADYNPRKDLKPGDPEYESLSLSLATCIAVERGETNGEMKTARDKAKTAQEEYEDFVHELASEQATSI